MEFGRLRKEARERARDMYPEVQIMDFETYEMAWSNELKREMFEKHFLLGCEFVLEQLKEEKDERTVD